MIEREFIIQKTKEYYIKKYIENKLKGAGISHVTLKKIPLGEKIIISAGRPSLIIGSKGANIRDLTRTLKLDFKLENPQIEINEVKDIFLDANLVADRIVSSLERFGSVRFKSIGHKIMENVLNAGALGIEIIISGKIPGARAKSWRFFQGYLKKCGDIAVSGVLKSQKSALLKSGIIGVKVSIMPPHLQLPDLIEVLDKPIQTIEVIAEKEEKPAKKTAVKKKSTSRKRAVKSETKEKTSENAPQEEVIPMQESDVTVADGAVANETVPRVNARSDAINGSNNADKAEGHKKEDNT